MSIFDINNKRINYGGDASIIGKGLGYLVEVFYWYIGKM